MKTAIIFGAGNIGRGFLGQLFNESGYSLVMVDIDQVLLDALNHHHSYTIQLVDNDSHTSVSVTPVQAIHSNDRAAGVEALCQANLGATAVGARVLLHIAPLVAQGMKERMSRGITDPLNLILCENLKGAAQLFGEMISEHLNSAEHDYMERYLGLVDTVIGRMVPPPTPEMRQADPGMILVEPYKELPVDRHGFIGEIPAISGMEPIDNFPAYTARKLYIHNCGHATLAYQGYLKGYEFGWQALQDAEVYQAVRQALEEAKAGVVARYGVTPEWLEAHIVDLLRRFANRALGDTVFRLGRDPVRKLAPEDRLVGAARLAEVAGVEPRGIAWAIAAGYRFNPPDDPIAVELQERISSQGFDRVLEQISAIQPAEPLAGWIREYYLAM
jgi:mannitol-1-phosphate 5-dehydrogenase